VTGSGPPIMRPAPSGWAMTRPTRSPTATRASTTSPTPTPSVPACTPPSVRRTRCCPALRWVAVWRITSSRWPEPRRGSAQLVQRAEHRWLGDGRARQFHGRRRRVTGDRLLRSPDRRNRRTRRRRSAPHRSSLRRGKPSFHAAAGASGRPVECPRDPCAGQTYTVELNGIQVTQFTNPYADRGVPSRPDAPSFIGLQTHTGIVAFRNILIETV
jgi:hypothetical protein